MCNIAFHATLHYVWHCITCNIALRTTLHYVQHYITFNIALPRTLHYVKHYCNMCNFALIELSSKLWISFWNLPSLICPTFCEVFVDVTMKALTWRWIPLLGLNVESPWCGSQWATLVTIFDVEATLVFWVHNISNPHFVNAKPSGLHSVEHRITFLTVL